MKMINDKSKWYRILLKAHDTNIISTQKLCEELGLNYNEEVKNIRKIMGENNENQQSR